MIRSIHPFPARMAPEIVKDALADLPSRSKVLDPLAGSGTVLRWASELGHYAIGRDLDPLAVTIADAWTSPAKLSSFTETAAHLVEEAFAREPGPLGWIEKDKETQEFINYWFANPQKMDLYRIAYQLTLIEQEDCRTPRIIVQLLKTAFSRMIITKDNGASLARDVSHSRPHKVKEQTDYNVRSMYIKIVADIRRRLELAPPPGRTSVCLGDARQLTGIANQSIDAVVTSPPYLNAIDYLRAHRMSLVWLGYTLSELRATRSSSIGAERGPDSDQDPGLFDQIVESMVSRHIYGDRRDGMIRRYAEDLYRTASEISRVLHKKGRAILVIGNSTIGGKFVRNAEGMATAARMVGLSLRQCSERDLPIAKRYLPINDGSSSLTKRMRTESILTLGA